MPSSFEIPSTSPPRSFPIVEPLSRALAMAEDLAVEKAGNAEARTRREQLAWRVRALAAVAMVGALWGYFIFPDAMRVAVQCTVVSHVAPRFGRGGNPGRVVLEYQGEKYALEVVGAAASDADIASEFAKWPVGSRQTCYAYPSPTAEQLALSRPSLVPPLLLLAAALGGILVSISKMPTKKAPRAATGPVNPYREPGRREATPPVRLRWTGQAYSLSKRAVPAIFAFLFFATLVLTGVLVGDGGVASPLAFNDFRSRFTLLLIVLFCFPGAVCWPFVWLLFARRGLELDADQALVTTWVGLPLFRRKVFYDLDPAAWRNERAIVSGSDVIVLPDNFLATPLVDAWLVEWKRYVEDR